MSHVDEGELTAYADGAYPAGDAAAQRIAAHLALCEDCRNRLAQARALTGRATEILALAAPAEMKAPDFDRLRAAATARRAQRPAIPLTWAATVILALGIGWFGRGALNDPAQVRLTRSQPRSETAADMATAPPPAAPATAAPAGTSAADAGPEPAPAPVRDPAPGAAPETRAATAPATAPAPAKEAAAQNFRALATTDEAVTGRAAAADLADVEYLTAAEAERRGIKLHFIPELEIMRIGLRVGGVQVEQKLADGTIVTIANVAEREADLAGERAAARSEVAAAAPPAGRAEPLRDRAAKVQEAPMARQTRVNSVEVTLDSARLRISAALPADSLQALAAKIR